MSYRVIFSPQAKKQLARLARYIARASSPKTAEQYTKEIVFFCQSLRAFPLRTQARDDIRPGMRITNYEKRVTIVLSVKADLVSILGIYYAGQDYETILRDDTDD
jgi:hypothetical protein